MVMPRVGLKRSRWTLPAQSAKKDTLRIVTKTLLADVGF
jgi:hypothetical protein